MNEPAFSSCLAESLSRYIRLRRLSNGSDDSAAIKMLLHWDRFVRDSQWSLPAVTGELVESYSRALAARSPESRRRQLSAVRGFCLHLRQAQPGSHVPAAPFRRAKIPRTPWILTDRQIRDLMEAARRTCRGPLQPLAYSTLLGVLRCTGLRIAEALALNISDVQERPPALMVRRGKFRKERWVPLSDSADRALKAYLRLRVGIPPRHGEAPLWLDSRHRRPRCKQVYATFRRLLAHCGIRGLTGPGPCLHDMRHSFAVNRLLAWYRQGRDVNALLPALATCMGHVGIGSTQVYLHATAELLEQASLRFADSFRRRVLHQGDPS